MAFPQHPDDVATPPPPCGAILFLACSHNLVYQAQSCLSSIERNYPDHPAIWIHHSDMIEDDIQFLLKFAKRIVFVKIDPLDEILQGPSHKGPRHASTSVMFYVRLLAWSRQYDFADKILYLDIDTVVIRTLAPLLQSDDFLIFPNNPLGHTAVFRNIWDPKLLQLLAEDGHPPEMASAPNSGVLLIPKRFRTEAHRQDLIRLMNRYANYSAFADQGVLTLWLRENRIPIQSNMDGNFQLRDFRLSGFSQLFWSRRKSISVIHINGCMSRNLRKTTTWFVAHGARQCPFVFVGYYYLVKFFRKALTLFSQLSQSSAVFGDAI